MGRAILNQNFRHLLVLDTEKTIRESGLNLSDEEIQHLIVSIERFRENHLDLSGIGIEDFIAVVKQINQFSD